MKNIIKTAEISKLLIKLAVIKVLFGICTIFSSLVYKNFIYAMLETPNITSVCINLFSGTVLLVLSSLLNASITKLSSLLRTTYAINIRKGILASPNLATIEAPSKKALLYDYVKESEQGFINYIDIAIFFLCCFAYCGFMMEQSFFLSVVSFTFIPLTAFIQKRLFRKIHFSDGEYKLAYSCYEANVGEMLSDPIQIKTTCSQEYICVKFKKEWSKLNSISKKRFKLWCIEIALVEINEKVISKVLLLIVGCILAARNIISIAALIVLLSYHEDLTQYTKRINEIIISLPGIHNAFSQISASLAYQTHIDCSRDTPARSENSLVLSNVHYTYDVDPIITECNIQINCPGIYLIMGESGIGKTTLAKLISGDFCPRVGNVKVNGQEVSDIPPYIRRNLLTSSHSDFMLFNASLRDNILLGKEIADYAYQRIICKLKIEHIEEMKTIGDNGNLLSAGERQKIAFARQLIRNSYIYIFDEILSNFDIDSAHQAISLLREIAHDSIVLIVSHDERLLDYANGVIRITHKKITFDIF